jgi:hypothetical protein
VIPIVGYADDAILVAWVIRSLVRRSGSETLARHWPGSSDGLELVTRLAAGEPSGRRECPQAEGSSGTPAAEASGPGSPSPP